MQSVLVPTCHPSVRTLSPQHRAQSCSEPSGQSRNPPAAPESPSWWASSHLRTRVQNVYPRKHSKALKSSLPSHSTAQLFWEKSISTKKRGHALPRSAPRAPKVQQLGEKPLGGKRRPQQTSNTDQSKRRLEILLFSEVRRVQGLAGLKSVGNICVYRTNTCFDLVQASHVHGL